MIKRSLWAILAIFVAWSILDLLLHGVILRNTYVATANLWRLPEEMKRATMAFVTLLHAVFFVAMYAALVDRKSLRRGLLYGLLFGATIGLGMGFGTWCVMPIPASLAWTWFLGTTVEAAVAGGLVGLLVKSKA